MRVITWNMGCSFGHQYRNSQQRTWQQLLAWAPDVALVQETTRPAGLDPALYTFTPYPHTDEIGTLVYSKAGLNPVEPTGTFRNAVRGQVTLATVPSNGFDFLVASIHAVTDAVKPALLEDLDVTKVSSWPGDHCYSLDLILEDLKPLTFRKRFIVGGDLNAALRWDSAKGNRTQHSAYTKWFLKSRDAGWWSAHAKFHAGEQRTLFRPGREELLQLDHLFTDGRTRELLTSCEVLAVPYLNEFTDHAPLALEW